MAKKKLSDAEAEVKAVMSKHYGNTMFGDEDKIICHLLKLGYSQPVAEAAVIAVTTAHLKGYHGKQKTLK